MWLDEEIEDEEEDCGVDNLSGCILNTGNGSEEFLQWLEQGKAIKGRNSEIVMGQGERGDRTEALEGVWS